MDIDELVVTTENINVGEDSLAPKPKRKKTQAKDVLEVTDHELIRKRDILASVALLDGLESYIGENITAAQIRNMKKEKLESYFMLYQEKAGQEATNDMMLSLVEMTVKGLSYAVKIDNEEDLKNDLINNKQLRRTIGRQAAEITGKYGDAVAILRVMFDIYKHLSFTPQEDASTNPAPASTMLAQNKINLIPASTMLAQNKINPIAASTK